MGLSAPPTELAQAVQHHQAGQFDQAARLYRQILDRDPAHVDALQLLGLLAYQCGDHLQALDLISRAIALRPTVAVYHSNLAEVYRALGQLDRAVACARTALGLQPHYAGAANNLGLALLARGKTHEAIEQFRQVLRLQPDFARGHNNLGIALRLAGDRTGALEHFRQAVRLDPSYAEAHSNLGQLLLEQHQVAAALHDCREAVRLNPCFAEAHDNLGNALLEQGKRQEAKACYADALRLSPHLAMAHNNMGHALQEEGHFDEALSYYQRGLQLEPNAAYLHCNLASLYAEEQQDEQAIAQYRRALACDPQYAEAYRGLGFVLNERGDFQEALACYREALRLRPDFAEAHSLLAEALEQIGDFAAAEASFREALRQHSRHADAYGQLATMLRDRLPDADFQAMRRLLADPDLRPDKRAVLQFGLAQVLDARGQYDEAAELLLQANTKCRSEWEKRGRGYDPTNHEQFVDGLLATYTPEFFERIRGFGLDSERPVFIVGLPRSGTTLVEQILASHSQVFGAGERLYVQQAFESLPTVMGRELSSPSPWLGEGGGVFSSLTPHPNPPPQGGREKSAATPIECVARLDRAAIQRLGQTHLERLRALAVTAARVTDKMPDNYLQLGFIAALFPKARVIHCRRDLRDTAVSCWMTQFRHVHWASDLEHIRSRFAAYARVMAHWDAVLPVPVLHVDYEETVADLEGVARRLVEWCGLAWEPACLAFHETHRPIRTASVTQVRRPVFRGSLGRWKNYEPALATLFEKLSGLRGMVPTSQALRKLSRT